MVSSYGELCNQLSCGDRREKIAALKELRERCLAPQVTADQALAAFDECYLYILKCYSDRYESVRDEAITTVSCFIKKLPPTDFHFLNIIETLTERMGGEETLEDSEELRLKFIVQVTELIQQCMKCRSMCYEEVYAELTKVLRKAFRDGYPSVQRAACVTAVELSKARATLELSQLAENLVKPLTNMLYYKHSQTRVAAVNALGHLALHVSSKTDTLSNLFMEISPLLMDSMPMVRRECGSFGILMMLKLRDRYSLFERLIPMVLCCLKDECSSVQEFIRPLWEACGKQYYEENEEELSKQDLVDLPVENYPKNVKRPTIGCRAIIQRSLRMLKLIGRESADWKESVRLHSLKLLYQFVLHAEAAMTAKFFEIYPDVAIACCDPEEEIKNEALNVSDLMGRLLSYDDWCDHGFEGLEKHAREGYLKCFYCMFTSTTGAKEADVVKVSSILVRSEFSQKLKPEFQLFVIKLVKTLLDKWGGFQKNEVTVSDLSLYDGENENLYKNLYVITVKVVALSLSHNNKKHSEMLQNDGTKILERIATYAGISVQQLHEDYLEAALSYVDSLDAGLDSNSEPILLLHGLILFCQFRQSSLSLLCSKLNDVWNNCADDAKINIYSAITMAMLYWSKTIALDVAKSVTLLKRFIHEVIEAHLTWKAGSNMESMRSMATATLCSICTGAKEEAAIILPTLAKYFPTLLEDRSTTTRRYALKCLRGFGPVKMEDLKGIAYAVLQRLDDPAATIRELAPSLIPELKPNFENEEAEWDRKVWKSFVQKALEIFFLHLDVPEIKVKMAVKEALILMSTVYEEDFIYCFKNASKNTQNNLCLEELQKEISIEI